MKLTHRSESPSQRMTGHLRIGLLHSTNMTVHHEWADHTVWSMTGFYVKLKYCLGTPYIEFTAFFGFTIFFQKQWFSTSVALRVGTLHAHGQAVTQIKHWFQWTITLSSLNQHYIIVVIMSLADNQSLPEKKYQQCFWEMAQKCSATHFWALIHQLRTTALKHFGMHKLHIV